MSTKHCLPSKLIASVLAASQVITAPSYGGGGLWPPESERDFPSPAQAPDSFCRHVRAKGTWHATEKGLLLQAEGDVLVGSNCPKNLCISTDGDVRFERSTQILGDLAIQARRIFVPQDVQIQGYTHLWGDTLEVSKTFMTEKGIRLAMREILNKGLFSALGAGMSGHSTLFRNEGKLDLSIAQINLETLRNASTGVIRTRNHLQIDGKVFQNQGTIFTHGVHQVTMQELYEDGGHVYAPGLLLVRAPHVTYLPEQYSWLREGLITASEHLRISSNTHFSLRSDENRCFLQFSSGGDLTYGGEITQHSAIFPFNAYDEIWERPSKSVFLGKRLAVAKQHPLAQTPPSLAAWDHHRPKESGVVFQTQGNALDLGGSVALTAGRVRKVVKGKLQADGLTLQAGRFTGDSVRSWSQQAYLQDTLFSALQGEVSTAVAEEAHLDRTRLLGGSAVTLSAQSLTFENKSFLQSLLGATALQVPGSTIIRDSGLEAKTTAFLSTRTLNSDGLKMTGHDNQVDIRENGKLSRSTLKAQKHNAVMAGGHLEASQSTFRGEASGLKARDLTVSAHRTQGDLVLVADQKMEVQGLDVDGIATATAQKVRFSRRDAQASALHVQAQKITNTTTLRTKKDFSQRADYVQQFGTIEAGDNSYTEARLGYKDSSASRDHAGRQNALVAPRTERFSGQRTAGELSYLHMGSKTARDLAHLRARTNAPTEVYELPHAELDFHDDTAFHRDTIVKAKRMDVYKNLRANGNFRAQLSEAYTTHATGDVQIHGQGEFYAEKALTNRGSMAGGQGLGLETRGVLTHKKHASGGAGTLRMKGRIVDAVAENIHKRATFMGDEVEVESQEEILADGAQLRAHKARLKAGGLLRLGAVVEERSSEHKESCCLGLGEKKIRRTWQEGAVFEAECDEELELISTNDRVEGKGAQLEAPTVKIHGEKGIHLADLPLTSTEEVAKTRPVFQLLGIDIFGPLEDGIPAPKLSVEMGVRSQTTKVTQRSSVLGGIQAKRLEVSTGARAETNLQGSHVKAERFITDTPILRLGGAMAEMSSESTTIKATAGIEYMGGLMPTASVGGSFQRDTFRQCQSASIEIGHLENRHEGMQLHVANGADGGIRASSGAGWRAEIDHTQNEHTQRGTTISAGISGGNFTSSFGARWGKKGSSESTHFDIRNAPNLTQRTDVRHEDSDNRAGLTLSYGADLSQGALTSGGISVQVRDQTIGLDSRMLSAGESPDSNPATSGFQGFLETTSYTVSQARRMTSMASMAAGAATLAGARIQPVQDALETLSNGLSYAEQGVSIASQLHGLFQSRDLPDVVVESASLYSPAEVIVEDLREQEVAVERAPSSEGTPLREEEGTASPQPQPKTFSRKTHRQTSTSSQSAEETQQTPAPFEGNPEGLEALIQDGISRQRSRHEQQGRPWTAEIEQRIRQQVTQSLSGAMEEDPLGNELISAGMGALGRLAFHGAQAAGRYVFSAVQEAVGDALRECAANHAADALGVDREQAHLAFQLGSRILSQGTTVHVHQGTPRSTLFSRDSLGKASTIEVLEKPGAIRFRGNEVRAVPDLSHLPEAHLRAMAERGIAPLNLEGHKFHLHHLNQQDHRLPGAQQVMIPQPYHTIKNSRQHPLGTEAGIGEQARQAHPTFRKALYKEMGRQELARRGLTGSNGRK